MENKLYNLNLNTYPITHKNIVGLQLLGNLLKTKKVVSLQLF